MKTCFTAFPTEPNKPQSGGAAAAGSLLAPGWGGRGTPAAAGTASDQGLPFSRPLGDSGRLRLTVGNPCDLGSLPGPSLCGAWQESWFLGFPLGNPSPQGSAKVCPALGDLGTEKGVSFGVCSRPQVPVLLRPQELHPKPCPDACCPLQAPHGHSAWSWLPASSSPTGGRATHQRL